MKYIVFILSFFLFNEIQAKALVLIIASDNRPVYRELQNIWRSYMRRYPELVEVYFIKADPNLGAQCEVRDDVIWSKTVENLKPGITIKTLYSLDFLSSRLDEFDFVLRTNLSSFYIFSRYIQFLETLPKERCYCGNLCGCKSLPYNFAQGAGITLSTDVAKFLVSNKEQIIAMPDFDDVVIGKFLISHGYELIPAPRTDFPDIQSWDQGKDQIDPKAFHFRVKNNSRKLRMRDELYIQRELCKLFYP